MAAVVNGPYVTPSPQQRAADFATSLTRTPTPTAPIAGSAAAGTSGGAPTVIGQTLDTRTSAWGSGTGTPPPVTAAVTGPKGQYDPTGTKGYYNPLPTTLTGTDITAYNAMITAAKATGGTVQQQGAAFDAQVQTAFLAQNPGVHTTLKPGDPNFWGSVYGQLVNGPAPAPVTTAPAGGNASSLLPAAVTTSPVSPQGTGTIAATSPLDTGTGSAVTSSAAATTGAGGAFDPGSSVAQSPATGTTAAAGMTTADLALIGIAAAGLLLTMHGRKGHK